MICVQYLLVLPNRQRSRLQHTHAKVAWFNLERYFIQGITISSRIFERNISSRDESEWLSPEIHFATVPEFYRNSTAERLVVFRIWNVAIRHFVGYIFDLV